MKSKNSNQTSTLGKSRLIFEFSFDDGFRRLHPTDILVHCEYSFHVLWDNFKHVGHIEFFEVVTTTKEIMLFHDLGVVVLRFPGGYNKSFGNCGSSGRLVD